MLQAILTKRALKVTTSKCQSVYLIVNFPSICLQLNPRMSYLKCFWFEGNCVIYACGAENIAEDRSSTYAEHQIHPDSVIVSTSSSG